MSKGRKSKIEEPTLARMGYHIESKREERERKEERVNRSQVTTVEKPENISFGVPRTVPGMGQNLATNQSMGFKNIQGFSHSPIKDGQTKSNHEDQIHPSQGASN